LPARAACSETSCSWHSGGWPAETQPSRPFRHGRQCMGVGRNLLFPITVPRNPPVTRATASCAVDRGTAVSTSSRSPPANAPRSPYRPDHRVPRRPRRRLGGFAKVNERAWPTPPDPSAAEAAIGGDDPHRDWDLRPETHAYTLPPEAGALKRILQSPEIKRIMERYSERDREAVHQQAR
jgi:hypothetical protein